MNANRPLARAIQALLKSATKAKADKVCDLADKAVRQYVEGRPERYQRANANALADGMDGVSRADFAEHELRRMKAGMLPVSFMEQVKTAARDIVAGDCSKHDRAWLASMAMDLDTPAEVHPVPFKLGPMHATLSVSTEGKVTESHKPGTAPIPFHPRTRRLIEHEADRIRKKRKSKKATDALKHKAEATKAKIIERFNADPWHKRRWQGGLRADVVAAIQRDWKDAPEDDTIRNTVNAYLTSLRKP